MELAITKGTETKVVYGYLRPQLQAMHLHFLNRGFLEKKRGNTGLLHAEK